MTTLNKHFYLNKQIKNYIKA